MNEFKSSLKFCVIFVMLALTAFISNDASGQVSGIIFKDFNSDGKRDLPNEIGMAGITVNAFKDNTPISTVTDKDGNYSFLASDFPASTPVRIEFVNLDGMFVGRKGLQSNSSVQFITAGAGAKVDLGVLSSDDYCGINELSQILTTCYVSGNPLLNGSAGEDAAIVTFPYMANGLAGVDGAPTLKYIAKAKEVGSVWGLTYQTRSKSFFMSALVRRHVGLGFLGTGGIYKYDEANNVFSPFLNVETLGIDTGQDPHFGLQGDKLATSEDSLTIHYAGKAGIGGMTLSSDEKTLYFINLKDRKLYSLEVGLPVVAPSDLNQVKSYTIPDPSNIGDYRPWAVKEHNGRLYVGVVTTAESTQDTSKMKAYVFQLDKVTGTFTETFSFPLSFKRGQADASGSCVKYDHWNPWLDKFPQSCSIFFDVTRGKFVNFAMYPQPILSSIGFDVDGSLLLGFMDRFGLFAGYRNKRPVDDGMLYDGFVGGDMQRAQYDPITKKYTLESNGKSGDLVGCGVGNGQGPGGGEFFCKDEWIYFGNPGHSETTNGGVLVVPELGDIIASAMDPVDSIYQSGGIRVFNRTNGELKRGFALYSDQPGALGKSGGVGELKLNCSPTPIEIGNRIWADTNFNGIQDPTEEGVDDVIVSLFDMDAGGIEIGKDTTGHGGIYCFNAGNTPSLDYERHYEIRFDFGQNIIKNNNFLKISTKDADATENGDERDSDGTLIGNTIVIALTSGSAGQTNNSYDIGLVKCSPTNAGTDVAICEPQKTFKLADADANQSWSFISGPATALISSTTGDITNMTSNGDYYFALSFTPVGLACSDTVRVRKNVLPDGGPDLIGNTAVCYQDIPLDVTLSAITPNGTWSVVAGNPTAATIDANGKIAGLTSLGFYKFLYTSNTCSDTVKVEVANCSLGELGDYVWLDFNNNGLQDGDEKGVSGIIVELYQETTPLASVASNKLRAFKAQAESILIGIDTTDASGKYLFQNLPSGTYFIKVDVESIPDSLELADNYNEGANNTDDSDVNPTTLVSESVIIDNFISTERVYIDLDIGLQFKCYQPNAGEDIVFCAPVQTYKLINTQTGQFWKFIYGPTGVALDTLSGQIDGLVNDGVYNFLLVFDKAGFRCSDTVSVKKVPLANGGLDVEVCSSEGAAQLNAISTDGTWSIAAGNPKTTTITTTGAVSGLTTIGKYYYIYTNTNQCTDTVLINVVDCDFGRIGDTVWLDENDNGIQDTGEVGVQGIVIQLCKVDANGVVIGAPIANDTTDINGKYIFENLSDGDYRVSIVFSSLPNNYQISVKQNIGTNDVIDSDFSRTTGKSDVVKIDNKGLKNNILTVDAGLINTCKPICIPFLITKTK